MLIVNPEAKVTVYRRYDEEGKTRTFKCMDEFRRWHDPKHHGKIGGVNSQATFTDLLLDELSDSPRGRLATVMKQHQSAVPAQPRRNHKVKANGTLYGSCWKAWEALKLPTNKFQKFRSELKRRKKMTFDKTDFELVEE